MVRVKASLDDLDTFMEYDIYLPSRTIYMGSCSEVEGVEGGTDYLMAERMIKSLYILNNKYPKGDGPITIIMNNIGGDEFHGMAIYDAIKDSVNHITIKVYGHAMSMGSLILQAADKRMMSKNSEMMIHYGTWGHNDHSKIVYKWAERGKKFDNWMENIYLEKIREVNPKFSKKKLQDMLNFDTFFDAEEALSMGLIDEIINP